MFFMMVCFEVFYFEFTINLPPPTGGGLVQRFGICKCGRLRVSNLSNRYDFEAGYSP